MPLIPAPRPAAPAEPAPAGRGSSSRATEPRTADPRAVDTRSAEPRINLFGAQPSPATVRERMAQSSRLESAGKFADALAVLEDLARNIPPAERSVEMTTAMDRLRERVQRENARRVFED